MEAPGGHVPSVPSVPSPKSGTGPDVPYSTPLGRLQPTNAFLGTDTRRRPIIFQGFFFVG